MDILILYQFLHNYLGKSWTHFLGLPYWEILQFWSSGQGWYKNEKKKNSGNCKALCIKYKRKNLIETTFSKNKITVLLKLKVKIDTESLPILQRSLNFFQSK